MPIKIPYSKGMPITKNEEGKYEYPNVEEYIKLLPAEKKKVYDNERKSQAQTIKSC